MADMFRVDDKVAVVVGGGQVVLEKLWGTDWHNTGPKWL